MKKQIRKTWPKIRLVIIKGQKFYRVDARRVGTNGKQETFKLKEDAEKRAGEIEEQFSTNGSEGLAFPVEIRGMAITATNLLQPYGKTIIQAAEFYKAHLDELKKRQDSALVSALAKAWYAEKKSGKHKKLRADTLRGIFEASEILKETFGKRRILDVAPADVRKYLDGLNVGLRRKYNLRSLLSQFFNWCIGHECIKENPAASIRIHVSTTDVAIFTPAETLRVLKKCEAEFKDLLLYTAISLFAGLRPSECRLLAWEQIHLEEKTITVLGETSKTKETRNVPVESTLMAWLEEYKPAKLSGSIIPHQNFVKRAKSLHSALGYKGTGENPDAPDWPQDVMRHCYGSYWLAKYKQRAVLAEHMGNTVEMIKKHYKKVVSKADCAEYWRIVPGYDGKGTETTTPPSAEELRSARAKKMAEALE